MSKNSWVASITIFALAILLTGVTGAQAAPGCDAGGDECPPLLNQFGSFGSGAGQMRSPVVAADPVTGHIFLAELGNGRVAEFDSSGAFIEAWGWGVRDGGSELQVCTAETGCQKGIEGTGSGQIEFPFGIAIDEEGNVWMPEPFSFRVQKFSPDGEFLLMVGGEVNKTKVEERENQEANAEPVIVTEAEENLCTAASNDVCGGGTSGTGNGQFQQFGSGNPIDVALGGTVYVGEQGRIQKFEEDGTHLGNIPLPGAGVTNSLSIAPDGRLYVISAGILEKVSDGKELRDSTVVREIGPLGEEISRLKGEWEGRAIPKDPRAVAVDAEGNVYVSSSVVYTVPVNEGDPPKFEEIEEVIAFDAEGDLITFQSDRAGFGAPADSSDLLRIATNIVGDGSGAPGEVLVAHNFNGALSGKPSLSYIRSYGVPFERKVEAPEIEEQYATSVTATTASVKAVINPNFAPDTTFQVEYGPGACDTGGCPFLAPVSPALLGGAGGTGIATGPVSLIGLEPNTTYNFRFAAHNEVGNATPIAEGTFTTFSDGSIDLDCTNDQFRKGGGALLPDCRAYEIVSPLDKDGGQIYPLPNVTGYPAGIDRSAASGNAFTYSSYRAFGDPDAAPYTSQYLTRRDPTTGWTSESISPLREGSLVANIDGQYQALSEDLSEGWFVTDSEPPLAVGAIPGQRNLYRRDSLGAYQAQCPKGAPEAKAGELRLEVQGKSADGSHLVFWANDKLTDDAVGGKVPQVYECVNGTDLRLVSVLPAGGASPSGGSAGSGEGGIFGFGFRENNVIGAISEDGSRIFWTAGSAPGALYVRIGGSKTIEIAPANARFRMASSDGTRVLYTIGEDLFEATVGSESTTSAKIAGKIEGFMGASEDTQLAYFVSDEDLDGGGNAVAGDNNLYIYRSGPDTYTFIAALSEEDAREVFLFEEKRPVLTPVARVPYVRSSRVTPDGLHAVFTSNASLTGYDNTDAESGEADAEVFLYDAEANELLCASCNPTGARPRGETADSTLPFWAAAKIPGWENQFHASRALSEDGNRLFFEAIDRLALADTNGVQDVYQWQAPGSGSCTESSSTYSPQNGGCVDLISSGKSPDPSKLVDASADGNDVFFKTFESLWSPDRGLMDLYDARVEGGFAPPPPPKDPCVEPGECRPAEPAPANPAPGTSTFVGPGDTVEKPKPKKCRKGTHKVKKAGKVRCVKNKKGKKGKGGNATKSRRPAR